jgi:transcriptional repressor NrdR
MTSACAKRPLPIGSIEKAIEDIESQLANIGRAEISSRVIGEMVMSRLRDLDRVAFIRFASVYRDFRDIENFREEVDALLEPKNLEESGQLFLMEDEDLSGPLRRKRGRRARRPRTGK